MERINPEYNTSELCPGILLASDIPSDEILNEGEFLILDDFHAVCAEYGIHQGSGTYAFNMLAYAISEDYPSTDPEYTSVYEQLFYDVLNVYNRDKTLRHRLLLSTQHVHDLFENNAVKAFLGQKSIDIVASVLFDSDPVSYIDEENEMHP